ncbi:hypothetical protein Fmac_011836 [Flemingia macrophylla]|uniref:Uncharacterized protein n=1 Tax=Flemingia macrophylla TaxID=520843 RepID=A0ABD1MNK9_9FABA
MSACSCSSTVDVFLYLKLKNEGVNSSNRGVFFVSRVGDGHVRRQLPLGRHNCFLTFEVLPALLPPPPPPAPLAAFGEGCLLYPLQQPSIKRLVCVPVEPAHSNFGCHSRQLSVLLLASNRFSSVSNHLLRRVGVPAKTL